METVYAVHLIQSFAVCSSLIEDWGTIFYGFDSLETKQTVKRKLPNSMEFIITANLKKILINTTH